MSAMHVVTTAAELMQAVRAPGNSTVEVRGTIDNASSLRLKPGQTLRGTPGASVRFEPGGDGVILADDNVIEHLELTTDLDRAAVRNDPDNGSFGHLVLNCLRTTGCVRLICQGSASGGHLQARDVHVIEADARGTEERPTGFGVRVVAGVFTVWNRQVSKGSRITADLRGIAAGRAGRPVRGSGILLGGTEAGGSMSISVLETGEIHSDGGIAPGTPDQISGGVFVLGGTDIDQVRNLGAVTTYGANDMALDNWGRVDTWHAHSKITSHGPSGIGFVNLGELGRLTIDAVLETHGLGACGFNSGEVKQPSPNTISETGKRDELGVDIQAGTVQWATFERVVTRGDGAIGIQVSVPVGRISVRRGIETYGGVGASLARGVVTRLAAVALSVKPGGSVREMIIQGGLTTHAAGIEAIELHGSIDTLRISGVVGPAGGGFTVS